MDYPITHEGGGLLVINNRGFDVWVRPPYVGIVNFDIYLGELKYNDRFRQLAYELIEQLAKRLGVGQTFWYDGSKQLHISIDLSVGEIDGLQMQQELAQLLDSEELIEKIVSTF